MLKNSGIIKKMLLTIDIGTSGFKSALWNTDGERLSFAAFPLSVKYNGLGYEADPIDWLRAFEECCRLLLNDKIKNLSLVRALVISGNGPTLVPVTEPPAFGRSVSSPAARLWLDNKLTKTAEKCQAEVCAVMGGHVDAAFFLPKVLTIKNEEEEIYRRTKFFLGCPEYLAYALTGAACSVFPSEGFDRWFWNDSVLEKLSLDKEKFPPFIGPGDLFGTLTAQNAQYFGFEKNIPVICGGPDFFAAILGAGITEPGQACDRTGSSDGINLCTEKRVTDGMLMSYGHPVKPFWNLSGIIKTTGKAIEWCRDLLGISCFEDFIALAGESKSGSGGLIFMPHLAGDRVSAGNASALGQWRGISLGSGRAEFANSVLEGICFAIRDVIAAMESAGRKNSLDTSINELRVTGGLAGIGYLNRLKADITGKKILVPVQKEAELLGLAIIGSCYLGAYSSWAEASRALVRIGEIYEPDLDKVGL